jgi:hypothetical protein
MFSAHVACAPRARLHQAFSRTLRSQKHSIVSIGPKFVCADRIRQVYVPHDVHAGASHLVTDINHLQFAKDAPTASPFSESWPAATRRNFIRNASSVHYHPTSSRSAQCLGVLIPVYRLKAEHDHAHRGLALP